MHKGSKASGRQRNASTANNHTSVVLTNTTLSEDASSSKFARSFVERNEEWQRRLESDKWRTGTVYSDAAKDVWVMDVDAKPNHHESSIVNPYVYFAVYKTGGGRYRRITNSQHLKGDIAPGSIEVVVPANQHVVDSPGGRSICIAVKPERIERLWSGFGEDDFLSRFDSSRLYRDPLIEQLLISIASHAEMSDLSSVYFDHALALILSQMRSAQSNVQTNRGLSSPQFRNVVEYIRYRLGDDVSLAELAKLVGLSISEFGRRFRVTAGVPPYTYVTQMRMQAATDLMSQTPLSIGEISAKVGYMNPSQFSRAFQRFAGLSPAKWRRSKI